MDHYNHHIESYVHNGQIGVLVEFDLRDQISTKSSSFTAFAKDIAIHIAASDPASVETLLLQSFVKDESITVGALVESLSKALHEQITIVRFVRWTADGMPPKCPESPEPPRNPAMLIRVQSS